LIVHQVLRTRRVTGLDGLKNGSVFRQRLLKTTFDAQRKKACQLEHLAQILDHLL